MLTKIGVECKTCDVSESFYSSMSVKRFRLEHLGHDIVEGSIYSPTGRRTTEASNGKQDGEKVRLLKVLVELVMLPSYTTPVFTITGVKDDMKNAFVEVVPPSQRDQVKETLEKGKYLDSGSRDTVYFWEPKSISFSKDANLAMSFGHPSDVTTLPAHANPAEEDSFQSETISKSGDVQEIPTATSAEEQSAAPSNEIAPQEAPVVLVPPKPLDSRALPAPSSSSAQAEVTHPTMAQSSMVEDVDDPITDPKANPMSSPGSMDVASLAQSEADEAAGMRSSQESKNPEVEESDYLLVSKSWYNEGGPKNMSEAVRISKLLRPFRWRVEPAYTIGVMVDDIMSVETASGDIGGDMTKQIEGAGYKLSCVSVEQGKPVAWFKKEPVSELGATGS